ncbi:hypothetical protein FXO37_35114 [Capsicum annuum]|nr:hypothetical protein FXO37_35114 [Capsicum annuum]
MVTVLRLFKILYNVPNKFYILNSAKLIDVYRTRHNISASTGLSDPAVATGISDLMYETTNTKAAEPETIDDDLVNFWAANLGDDSLNNAPAINRVNEFLAGAGTDAPDVEENIISRPSMSYDDMWAKTLLESSEMEEDDGRSSGSSSPDSVGSVETSISSHFGGMNYPSLFSSKPSTYGPSQSKGKSGGSRYNNNSYSGSSYDGLGSPIREEPPPYSSPIRERYESFENPLAGSGSHSFGSHEEERVSSSNPQSGTALYDFTAGGDDELNLTAGEELEIEYEVDGWFYDLLWSICHTGLGGMRAGVILLSRFSEVSDMGVDLEVGFVITLILGSGCLQFFLSVSLSKVKGTLSGSFLAVHSFSDDYLIIDGASLFQVKKKRPGRDGKMAGLVPVLYVNQS